ncbi:hypothetical protein QFZ67_007455 [Streptomyces sp. V1I1]|nr:hypothetical protein [Streptomyces sp. V1I1]
MLVFFRRARHAGKEPAATKAGEAQPDVARALPNPQVGDLLQALSTNCADQALLQMQMTGRWPLAPGGSRGQPPAGHAPGCYSMGSMSPAPMPRSCSLCSLRRRAFSFSR